MFVFVGCGQKEQVDEEDMSRWIIEFSSEYPNDMENGRAEVTVEELEKNDFTIKFQYKLEYEELAENNFEFNLLPEMTLYYVNDAGEKIKDGMLNDDRYYIEQNEKYIYDDFRDEFWSIGRVVRQGLYQIHYDIYKDDKNANYLENLLAVFILYIEIGNIG